MEEMQLIEAYRKIQEGFRELTGILDQQVRQYRTVMKEMGEAQPGRRFRARVNVGRDPAGMPVYKWASGWTRDELEAEKARILAEHQQQPIQRVIRPSTAPTFQAYGERWYALYKETDLRQSSITMYRNVLENHLFPMFGDRPINTITADDLQQFIIQYKEGSSSMISKVMMVLKQIFKGAVDDDIIPKNPTSKVRPPKGTVGERKPLTMEQVRQIQEMAPQHPDGLLVMLLLHTGMRRGEAVALRFEDIHDGMIHINKAAVYSNGNKATINAPKTRAGVRRIPLEAELRAVLPSGGTGYVLGGDEPWSKTKLARAWERLQRDIPALSGASPHILRHTYTMRLRRAGVDGATAQAILGHEDYQTTANVYTHIMDEDLSEASERLNQRKEKPTGKRLRARVNLGKDKDGHAIYRWVHAYTERDLLAEKERILREARVHG